MPADTGRSQPRDYSHSANSLRVAAAPLTHDTLLRRRRDDVADVQVLGGQFAVQAQEVAETPLDGKILALEEGEGGLEAQRRGWARWWR